MTALYFHRGQNESLRLENSWSIVMREGGFGETVAVERAES